VADYLSNRWRAEVCQRAFEREMEKWSMKGRMRVVKRCRESAGVRPCLKAGVTNMIDGHARAIGKGHVQEDVSVWLGRCVRRRYEDACGPAARCGYQEPDRFRPDWMAEARACRSGRGGLARARSVGQIEHLVPTLVAGDNLHAGLGDAKVLGDRCHNRLVGPAFVRPFVH